MAKVSKKVIKSVSNKADTSNILKVSFVLEKETKGALRYAEIDASGKIKEYPNVVMGTIYLRKDALGEKKPSNLTIRINLD